MNSAVRPIFNEKIVNKKVCEFREQYTRPTDRPLSCWNALLNAKKKKGKTQTLGEETLSKCLLGFNICKFILKPTWVNLVWFKFGLANRIYFEVLIKQRSILELLIGEEKSSLKKSLVRSSRLTVCLKTAYLAEIENFLLKV